MTAEHYPVRIERDAAGRNPGPREGGL